MRRRSARDGSLRAEAASEPVRTRHGLGGMARSVRRLYAELLPAQGAAAEKAPRGGK